MLDILTDPESGMGNARIPDGHHDLNTTRVGSGNNQAPWDNHSWPHFDNGLRHAAQYQADESDDDENIVTIQAAGLQPQSRPNPLASSRQSARPMPQIISRNTFEPSKLKKFEVSEQGLVLCPFKLVLSYPYQYVGKANQDKVGTFFNTNVFENRAWDMFYLHDPYSRRDPLILVPTVQFEQLLNNANSHIHTHLSIPRGIIAEKFLLTFGEFGNPRPRFAGRINNVDAYKSLKDMLLGAPHDNLGQLDGTSLEFFKEQMNVIYNSFKPPKSKKNPEVRHMKLLLRQKDWGRITKRVQRYLGLRQQAAYANMSESPDKPWNVDLPIPFKKECSVKFVSVDVEAYERNNNIITEIGIAILDTDDIEDVPPGENGKNWFTLIKADHLRINEARHLYNHEFVRGCPDSFDFGESESIAQKDVAKRVGAIIGDSNKTPVVMVGHDITMDLRYLQKIGYNIWNLPQIMDEVDTKSMFQRVQFASDGRSLQHLCSELDIPGRNFHNAGNDAVYTLRAMIVMAVKKKVGGPQTMSEAWSSQPTEDIRVDEWSDGEYDDGGSAVKSQEPVKAPLHPTQAPVRRDPFAYQKW